MHSSWSLRLALATLLLAGSAAAQERALPAPHVKAKLICHDCHQKEKPTTAAVPDEACMVCHGDYPAMKALTREAKPNPHGPPPTATHQAITCTDCHRQHKPPVVKCLECHEGQFTFKIK